MTTLTLPPSNSIRARLLRLITRWLIGPIFRSGYSPQQIRQKLEGITKLSQLLLPWGTRFTQETLGGVPVEWVDNRRISACGHILYFHGGAYIAGSAKSHRNLTAHLAKCCTVRVASVDYRLAPEHPFPAATDDALAAYRALLDSGVPASRIIISGDSAGGGLALACAIAIRDTGLPLPAALVCFSPWVDLIQSGASMTRQRDSEIILTREALAGAAAQYLTQTSPQQPLASPLFANLRGLPPLLIQVTDAEVLYNDSTRLAAAAEAQGVKVTLQIGPNLWHDWQLFAGQMPEANAALKLVAGFTNQCFKSN